MRFWRNHLETGYWIVAAMALLAGLAFAFALNRTHRFDDLIIRISQEQGLDPRVVSALIWKESRFKPDAVGTVGEIGLMQVTELVGHEWAYSAGIENFTAHDLFRPETNIRAGTWYLARALNDWSNRSDPLPYALAQYNAGRSNVLRWAKDDDGLSHLFIQRITFPGTRDYVEDILRRYRGRA